MGVFPCHIRREMRVSPCNVRREMRVFACNVRRGWDAEKRRDRPARGRREVRRERGDRGVQPRLVGGDLGEACEGAPTYMW